MPDTPTQVRGPTRPMLLQPEDIVPMSAREAADEIEALRRALDGYDRLMERTNPGS